MEGSTQLDEIIRLLLIPFIAFVSIVELQQSDLEDSKTCDALVDVDNSQLQVLT